MAAEPAQESALTARLIQTSKGYEGSWKPVDAELYDLCRRRPRHDDFADVYTKVAMIGRVYEAGVARAWRGVGDPESVITEVLLENAALIRSSLQRLAGRPFDRQTAAEIVELHGHIARAISRKTDGVFLASFVSKYLHFHCPIVPIYDSNAQAAIGHYVDQKVVRRIHKAMTQLPEWARGLTGTSSPPSSSCTSGPTPKPRSSRASRNSTTCCGSRAEPCLPPLLRAEQGLDSV